MAESMHIGRSARPGADKGVKSAEAFYYDIDGQRVRLLPSQQVAIDRSADVGHELQVELGTLAADAESLKDDYVLLEASNMSAALTDALDVVSGLQPVYTVDDGSRIVVLPEVRVESSDEAVTQGVRSFAKSDATDAELVKDGDKRLVLRPRSGKGTDAIAMANEVYESFSPDVSQARFVRLVRRPDTHRKVGQE